MFSAIAASVFAASMATSAPLAAPTPVQSDEAACERVKAVVSARGKFDRREIAFCDVLQRTDSPTDYYVLALHGSRPDCGGICSTNMGWFAVERASGRVFEWNMAEEHLGEAVVAFP